MANFKSKVTWQGVVTGVGLCVVLGMVLGRRR